MTRIMRVFSLHLRPVIVCFALTALAIPSFSTMVLGTAVAQDNKQALALYGEAANLQNGGEFELAVELWDSFVKKFPENSRILKAQHYRGVCYLQLKKHKEARDAFQEVINGLEKEPDFPLTEDALLNLGWCQYIIGQAGGEGAAEQFQQAAKNFGALLEKFPEGKLADQASYFLGESEYLQGNREEAVKAYQRVVDGFPKSTIRANALYALGVALQEQENNQAARAAFDQFLTEFADSNLVDEITVRKAETILQDALAAKNADKNEEANQQFAEAEKIFAEVSKSEQFNRIDHALYQQAFCLLSQSKYAEAAQAYAGIAEKFPNSSYAQASKLSAGKFFYKAGNDEAAEKWLSASLEDKVDAESATEAAHWLCRLQIKKKAFPAAAEIAAKQLNDAVGPFLVDLKMDQADALFEISGSREQSLELFKKIATDYADSPQAPQATYNAAYAALDLKKYDEGLALTQQFLDRFASDSLVNDVRYVRAECLIMTKKFAEAEAIYGELVKVQDHPDIQSWNIRYAMSMFMQKKYDETIKLLAEKVNTFADAAAKAESQYLVGASYFFTKRYEDAIKWLSDRLQAQPESKQNDEVLLLLGQSQFQTGQTDEALKTIQTLKTDFPESEFLNQANYYHGQFSAAKQDYVTAISEYGKVIAAAPSEFTPYAMFGQAWALQKTNKTAEASAAFSELIEKYADHELKDDALFGRGTCHRLAGEFQQAVEDLNACLEADPNFVDRRGAGYELGLAQIGLKQYGEAAATFTKLADDSDAGDLADDYLYQLGWAYKYAMDAENCNKRFAELVAKHVDSPFAAEASFHVGEFAYDNDKPDEAAKSYEFAVAKSSDPEIAEKAMFKLGWANYQQKKYDAAIDAFKQQTEKFPNGELAVDGAFMVAESQFQNSDYANSLQGFLKALPVVNEAEKTSENIKLLTRLHGAKSANEVKQYEATGKFLDSLEEVFAKSDYLADAWLEQGRAYRAQDQPDKAIEAFENAAIESLGATGAQARCLVGEVLFAQKNHNEAIKNYKRVMYGYGGEKASAEVKKWQALSGYEAARCTMVQIKDEQDAAKKQELIKNTQQLFTYVIEKHPDDKLAQQAKTELEKLSKLP